MIHDSEVCRKHVSQMFEMNLSCFWSLKWRKALQDRLECFLFSSRLIHGSSMCSFNLKPDASVQEFLVLETRTAPIVRVGDHIEVYVKLDNKKKKWVAHSSCYHPNRLLIWPCQIFRREQLNDECCIKKTFVQHLQKTLLQGWYKGRRKLLIEK